MSTVNEPLKYLFIAEYDDGTIFVQPEHDRTRDHNPKAEHNKSAYYDIDHDKLIRFALVPNTGKIEAPVIVVDLRDGHYEVGGVPFVAAEQNFVATKKLELVFFREVQLQKGEEDGVPFERHFINRYFVGWKTNQNGKAVTSLIGIV